MRTGILYFIGMALLVLPVTALGAEKSNVLQDYHLDELHEAAPDFTFTDIQGRKHDLKEYRGHPVLLHFWASWCEPCREELPQLKKLASQPGAKNWIFLPISVDQEKNRGKAIGFLKQLRAGIPFYSASPSDAVSQYQTWGLPVTYWINSKGEIVARALGKRDWLAKPEASHDLSLVFR